MKPKKVFVSRLIPQAGLDKLAGLNVKVWPEPLPPTKEQLIEGTKEADGLLCLLTDKVDAEVIKHCPRLKVISTMAVGVNNIDLAACKQAGISVGNTPDLLTDATADLAISLMLAAGRHLIPAYRQGSEGRWHTWDPMGHLGADFKNKVLGIFGMGRIGYAMAQRCQGAWDMQVLYTNRHSNNQFADQHLKAKRVDFETLLSECDVISIHADLNEDNKGLFDECAFARMKNSCLLVNSARGEIINTNDLINTLKSREIFAAGLDVTDPEPLPDDHPLWACKNAIITPHIGSATLNTRNQMAVRAADNLLAGLGGKPLISPVKLSEG